jgi:hypothetical protein
MAVLLLRTVMPNVSGMAKDEVVNDFVFNEPSSSADCITAVKSFWVGDHTGGGSAPVAGYINLSVSRLVHTMIQVYTLDGHLDGSPHGSPTAIDTTLVLTAAPVNSLPDPLAGVLSYHAAYGTAEEVGPVGAIPSDARARHEGAPTTHSGRSRPKSSLRGRVYIGPVATNSIGGLGGISAGFAASLAGAGNFLMTAALGWCVWSRRTASVHNIIGGWVDNELGVQRRRNTNPTGKSVWP